MKIYIAAPYPCRDQAIRIMEELESVGHEVTSRWLREDESESDASARDDLADVDAADVLLAYNPPEFENAGTGGRHVELGYMLYHIMNRRLVAWSSPKQIVIVGRRSNIFHHIDHPSIRVVDTVEAFLKLIDVPVRTRRITQTL